MDFSCAPSPRKPIVLAHGACHGDTVHLVGLDRLTTLAQFESALLQPGPWVGGFDFPFGLPREFVDSLRLGGTAAEVIGELHRRCAGQRMEMRRLVDAWGQGRPAGRRLVHRATDRAGAPVSSSPLQTRYVPVGFMYFEGLARLVRAGVSLPGLHEGDHRRVALEAYPARVAHALIGARSYKNSDAPDRRRARADMLAALRLQASPALCGQMLDDDGGDHLDAVLCLMQAAAAARRPRYGLPAGADPVEGWIVPWT